MAFNGFSRHSESIWFRYENKNVNTFGYKPYIKGKFISFVCFVCLFVVSLSFLFPFRGEVISCSTCRGQSGSATRAFLPVQKGGGGQGVGGRFPQGTTRNTRRKFLIKRQKKFSGRGSKCFWPLTDTRGKNRLHVSTHVFPKRDFNG